MAELKAGDKFPDGVVFMYAPPSGGQPRKYEASKEWKGKKVCLVSVPGAFTPTCSDAHLPPFIANLPQLRERGVDVVAVVASNDAFVMAAWAKANSLKDEDMLFMSDTGTKFAEKIGWMAAPGADRNGRFAMLIDRDGMIKYAERETSPKKVTVSGADAVLAKL